MKSSSFQKSFEKVHKRLQSILRRKHFLITDDDVESGTIKAKRKGILFRSDILINVTIRKIDNTSTQVSITADSQKKLFRVSEKRLRNIEGNILSVIS